VTEGAESPSVGGSEKAPPLRELVLYLARALVEHPDEVAVEEIEEPDATVFELKVAVSDLGGSSVARAVLPRPFARFFLRRQPK
jgi:hypothetical protein